MNARRFSSLTSLTTASVKMYYRNIVAVFFTLFIPVMLVVIFGLLNLGSGAGSVKLALTNQSSSPMAAELVTGLKKIEAFKIEELPREQAADKLGKGQTDLQVVIPANFGQTDARGVPLPGKIFAYFNQGRPQQGQTAGLILGQIVSQFNQRLTPTPQPILLEQQGVKTNNLGYIDFLIPGIMAMSIMQLGIFSVAFGFIAFKTTGALRRLQATPTPPVNFLIGQSVARLIIGVLQVCLLLALGLVFFELHLIGNVLSLLLVATLGTIVFLAFGFAIAGWAKDENQAAPVANLISFPMLFLSGVFFPRDGFPGFLKTITDFLPLTYLSDALRRIANEGAGLWEVRVDLIGLIVWGVIGYVIAIRLFRWE